MVTTEHPFNRRSSMSERQANPRSRDTDARRERRQRHADKNNVEPKSGRAGWRPLLICSVDCLVCAFFSFQGFRTPPQKQVLSYDLHVNVPTDRLRPSSASTNGGIMKKDSK